MADITKYRSQSAKDAESMKIGDRTYWDYLENHAHELHGYFRAKGDWKQADQAFTRPLTEALQGNEGN